MGSMKFAIRIICFEVLSVYCILCELKPQISELK
jgi:hypothetical protein